MSKLKDKKIKKLRKKRIWPSIFGLLFLLCIFALIILISMASSCLDIVQRKLNEGSDQAVRILRCHSSVFAIISSTFQPCLCHSQNHQ